MGVPEFRRFRGWGQVGPVHGGLKELREAQAKPLVDVGRKMKTGKAYRLSCREWIRWLMACWY